MIFRIKKNGHLSFINTGELVKISVILYFANSFVLTLMQRLVGTGSLATAISVLLVYVPAITACFFNPKKYIKIDMVIVYLFVVVFLMVTMVVHPEYDPYYFREGYGLWDHVFNPFRGIYAYFFVRLLESDKQVKKMLKISGWLMLIYFIYTYIVSTNRGYWYGVGLGMENGTIKMSYSVSFGYQVLPFALLFLYDAIETKKIKDIVPSAACIVLILIGGSRGPILFLALFLTLYVAVKINSSKRKLLMIIGLGIIGILIFVFYDYLIYALAGILSKFGLSSRFLTKLISGTITSDSGRGILWEAALKMIKENPFGYGFMGARHIIGNIIVAGYPHSIILEMWIEYGVIFGSLILAFLFCSSLKIIFNKKTDKWKGLFLVYFSSACCLLLSLTYWSVPTFWTALGIGVSFWTSKKNFQTHER